MTGRETVAAALIAKMRDGACEWAKLSEADQEFALGLADAAFASITLVAAERGWRMRPDEATADMKHAVFLAMDNAACRGDPKARAWDCVVGYRAMLADPTAQFELDK